MSGSTGKSRALGRASSRNERYDYDYSDEELQGWVSVIADLSKQEIYLYFNNHYRGKAVKMPGRWKAFSRPLCRDLRSHMSRRSNQEVSRHACPVAL